MTQLKLRIPYVLDFPTVVEENLLVLSFVDPEIVYKNPTFSNLNIDSLRPYLDFVNEDEECDFIHFPWKFNPMVNYSNIVKYAQSKNKKILFFFNDDLETPFELPNSILLRTSFDTRHQNTSTFAWPAFCEDLVKRYGRYPPREKCEVPVIGFCGCYSRGIREKVVNFVKTTNLHTNFIIRDNFWAGDTWGKRVRQEYVDNIQSSDYTLCMRGGGNFSYRFFETLCLGRIPIFIDSYTPIPFKELTGIEKLIPCIHEDNIDKLPEVVLDHWNNIGDYADLQKTLRNIWLEYYSPLGAIKSLIKIKEQLL